MEPLQQTDIKLKIIKEKHTQIPSLMKKLEISCWLIFARETITTPDSIMELTIGTDMVLHSAFIFAFKGEEFKKIAIVGNFDAHEQKVRGLWDEVVGYEKGISNDLQNVIQELDPKNIALDYSIDSIISDGLTHGMYLVLEKILDNYKHKFISAEKLISALRSVKTPTEIELIKKACQITEEINSNMTPFIRVGKTETELQALFYKEMDKFGVQEAWNKSQCPMIDAGPDKELGHVGPQESNKTKQGYTLHNDFGVRFNGYCSDLQRLWFFGSKNEVPEELRHAIDTIIEAIQIAARTIKPGLQGYEVDKIVREYIVSRGYEEYKHGLGHQVGIQAHDGGTLMGPLWERYGDTPKQLIEENQVYTIEPSLRTKSNGMIALEEMILVTKDGAKFIVPPVEDFIYIT